MSNKLKTFSSSQLEHFIKEKVDEYIDEDCACTVSNLDISNFKAEADPAETDTRNLTFDVEISYEE